MATYSDHMGFWLVFLGVPLLVGVAISAWAAMAAGSGGGLIVVVALMGLAGWLWSKVADTERRRTRT